MTDTIIARPERMRLGLSLPLTFGIIMYAAILGTGLASGTLSDADTYWHIAAGRWIIANGAVPHQDMFSFSMEGAPWTSPEWLAEVVFAWLYERFGWAGPIEATALSFALALGLLLRSLLRSMTPVYALIATVLACGLTLNHLLARPHILVLPLLVFWVAALVAARAEDRAPPVYLAPLMCLWVNLHSSYILGLGLAGLLAAEALLAAPDYRARLNALRGWALFGAASLGAALINPYGSDALVQPLRLATMSANKFILEWQSPNFQQNWAPELWILLILLGSLARGWRLPWTRAGMLLLLLHMTLQHARYAELLGFIAPVLAAPALGPQLEAPSAHRQAPRLDRIMAEWAKPASGWGIALAMACIVAISVMGLRRDSERQADAVTPSDALAVVTADHVKGPVLNEYSFGGYLIFRGIKPFIDGRYLYGDAFITRYMQTLTLTSDGLPQLLAEYHIAWTLLAPKSPANLILAHLPGWHRLYADDIAVVYAREEATPDWAP